jgi:hypothetical protein
MSFSLPADAVRPDWRMPPRLRRAARAIAEALFHDGQSPPSEEHLEWLMGEVEAFLGHAGGRSRAVFRASVLALTTLAPATVGKAPPLGRLDPASRAHAIERFEATPLGLAVLGAKAILCIHHYDAPSVRAELGLDGKCLVDEAAS